LDPFNLYSNQLSLTYLAVGFLNTIMFSGCELPQGPGLHNSTVPSTGDVLQEAEIRNHPVPPKVSPELIPPIACKKDEDVAMAFNEMIEAPAYLFKRIMQLPRELRDLVWRYKLAALNLPMTILMNHGLHPTPRDLPNMLPAFCYISSQVCLESLPLFFRNRHIILNSYADVLHLQQFIDNMNDPYEPLHPPIRWLCLRSSVFSVRQPVAAVEKLILSCTKLQHLCIEVRERPFLVRERPFVRAYRTATCRYRILPRDEVILPWGNLGFITDFEQLKSFDLLCVLPPRTWYARKWKVTRGDIFRVGTDWALQTFGNNPKVTLNIQYKELKELNLLNSGDPTGWSLLG
jgi:hypothetical protein